jgi:hypothetical protein
MLERTAGYACSFKYWLSSNFKHRRAPLDAAMFDACCCCRFMAEFATIPMFQALATAIAAVGSGVLLAGFMTGHVDGEGVWYFMCCPNVSSLCWFTTRRYW